MEQGSHSELLAQGGVFATMWAVQVQGIEDATSSHTNQKEAVSGYSVEEAPSTKEVDTAPADADVLAVPEPAPVDAHVVANGELVQAEESGETAEPEESGTGAESVLVEAPASGAVDSPVAFSTAEVTEEPSEIVEGAAAVAFPGSEDPETQGEEVPAAPSGESAAALAFPVSESPAPVAFPMVADDAQSQRAMSIPERAQTPQATGVTFQDVQTPSRSGTSGSPDPEAKRRRTLSTQGIQRLARRMSVSRRQDSASSIPKMAGSFIAGLKRESTSGSKDDSSTKDNRESPNASVSSDIGIKTKKLSKKEKKDKRKSGV